MTRDVVTLSQQSTILEIISLMANQGFRHYWVVEPPRRLVGIISDRDILRTLARKPNWRYCYAHDLMSGHVITVKLDTDLSVAAAKMLSNRINCLPVIDDYDNACGILTFTDLLKSYPGLRERMEHQSELTTSRAKRLIAVDGGRSANLKR
jgi:acetoin utilization protein AcuB